MGKLETEIRNDTFVPEPFRNTREITWLHNGGRFGHTNNVSAVIAGDKNAGKDYLTGVIVSAVVVFIIFFVWSLVLLVLKCLGKKRAGCLSGTMPPIPPPPPAAKASETDPCTPFHEEELLMTGEAAGGVGAPDSKVVTVDGIFPPQAVNSASAVDRALEEERTDPEFLAWKKGAERVRRRMKWTRILVLFCGVGIVTCTILYCVKGVDSLVNALQATARSLDKTVQTSELALNVTNTYLASENQTRTQVDDFIGQKEDTEEWCPNLQNNPEVQELKSTISEVIPELRGMKDGMLGEVIMLQGDLQQLINTVNQLKAQITGFTWAAYVAAAFAVFLDIIVIMLMINVILAWRKRLSTPFRCLHSFLFYPLFLVCLFLTWLFTTIFLIGSLVAADFCFNSPDVEVQYVLETYFKDSFSSLVFAFILFYVSGCKVEYKPLDIDDEVWIVLKVLGVIHFFINKVKEIPDDILQAACENSAEVVKAGADVLHSQLHIYIGLLQGVREIFFCENFNPIYTGISHEALCYNGASGLAWIFWTQLSIAFLSMVIITFRVSWEDVGLPAEAVESTGEEKAAKEAASQQDVKEHEDSPSSTGQMEEQAMSTDPQKEEGVTLY